MAKKKTMDRWDLLFANQDNRVHDHLKRGMKVKLVEDHPNSGAKKGDIVKITSLQVFGRQYDGPECDYEVLRVGNGKYTWRIGRHEIVLPDFKLK